MKKKLTKQEDIFVDEYLIGLDPEKAAKKAKYSNTAAKKQAHKWVRAGKQNPKPHIWNAIKKRLVAKKKRAETTAELAGGNRETEITTERVLKEIARLGYSNIQDFVGEDNVIKDISTLPRHVAAAVKGIETERVHEIDSEGKETNSYTDKVKLRFHSKERPLADLGKHLGIFEKDNRQQAESLAELLKTLKDG